MRLLPRAHEEAAPQVEMRLHEAEPGQLPEFFDVSGHAIPFQQGGCRRQDPGQGRDAPHHETLVDRIADEKAAVEAFFDELERTVDEVELRRDLRMPALEARERPRDNPLPDIDD